MSHSSTIWEIKEYDDAVAEEIKNKLGISMLLARLLTQRGIYTCQQAEKFLYGRLEDLVTPFGLSGMRYAVDRIEKAIRENEQIVVYGDYDVDGICSTVLMKKCLELLGGKTDYYVPDRFFEGYGLNRQAVEILAKRGYKLLITVDCGISSVEEIKLAADLGMDVIVTDHHTPLPHLPPASAIINPKLNQDSETENLAGAGVVFKLIMALCRGKILESDIYNWLDLVALATIADIVPLLGDNRILVKYGLEKLQNTDNIGLKALIAETGLDGKELLPWHVSFVLAPRLNAAGRIDNARLGIDLLLSSKPSEAADLAKNLVKINNERKSVEETIYKEATLQIKAAEGLEEKQVLVLAGDNWHPGVTGVVASRLAEKYSLPVLLVSWEGETGRGSARSIAGLNIWEALSSCSELLLRFGGHKMAAGFELRKKDFDTFKNRICEWVRENNSVEGSYRKQKIDAELETDNLNDNLLKELRLLEPFGEGNPRPRFVLRGVEMTSAFLVGKNKEHFKTRIGPAAIPIEGIAFNKPELINLPLKQCYQDAVFEVEENEFKGEKRIQLQIKDMKSSFIPDKRGFDSGTSLDLTPVLHKMLLELNKNRPVLVVYPTFRSLQKHRLILENFFQPHIIQILHGRLHIKDRIRIQNELKLGVGKVFLTTEAFLKYYIKHGKLPENLEYIVPVWPLNESELQECLGNYCVEELQELERELKWEQGNWNYDASKRILVYANRSKTMKQLALNLSNVTVEAGVKDIKKRKLLRRQFIESSSGVFLFDGGYVGEFSGANKIDELLFANIPFSSYEASSVLHQASKKDEVKILALFDRSELEFNRSYLARIYPDLEIVRGVLSYFKFKKAGRNPVQAEMGNLAACIADFTGKELTPFDLFPALQILSDLYLCQTRKKGSIIEIKFMPQKDPVFNISNSPYYLEGLAEKAAFNSWVEELNESLLW